MVQNCKQNNKQTCIYNSRCYVHTIPNSRCYVHTIPNSRCICYVNTILDIETRNFFWTNSSKNVNKGVHYRLVNQNPLSALDEMQALTNFDDIINNINITEATQLLFEKVLLNYALS